MTAQALQDELITAAAHGDARQLTILLEQGVDIDGTGGVGGYWTALTCATENGHLDTIRFLVIRGAKLNEAITDAGTPLHVAIDNAIDGAIQNAREVDWRTVALLLDLGADLRAPDNKGKTSLDAVAAYGDRARHEFDVFLEHYHQPHDG